MKPSFAALSIIDRMVVAVEMVRERCCGQPKHWKRLESHTPWRAAMRLRRG